ncbi:MAG: 2-phospho-L-lactate guanylyltransferase [Candidatus Heimdallarchaeota archaeon LC_2]|nr:MAG: 2-phospho-L-lactate guanylyltransferase [Candidatus Heimdallarchaeota archaeon LC_2]
MNLGDSKITAIVPLRSKTTAMSRLREDLGNKLVNDIVYNLMMNTIDILIGLNIEVIVLTSDETLYKNGSTRFKIIIDKGISLNKAVSDCLDQIEDDKILFVMPDLPGLTRKIMLKFLSVKELELNVIVPTHDRGTAIAYLPKFMFSKKLFGKSSADRFIGLSNKLKIALAVFEKEEISRDLDTLEDWYFWKSHIFELFFNGSK